MTKTRHHARFNGIDGVRKNYGDSRRRFFSSERCRRRHHDYYIDILLNQLSRKLLEPVRMALRISPLDDQIPTLLVPQFLEARVASRLGVRSLRVGRGLPLSAESSPLGVRRTLNQRESLIPIGCDFVALLPVPGDPFRI